MSNIINYLKEIRHWIILIFVLLLSIAIILQIRSCYKTENIKLQNQIVELQKQLESKPITTKVETKFKTIKICVDKTGKEIDCKSSPDVSSTVEITKEMCCRLGISTEFSNEYVICIDRDICKQGDEFIKITDKFKEYLNTNRNQKFSLFGGYDVYSSDFTFGAQFNTWYHTGIGLTIGSDFRNWSNTNIGILGTYRFNFGRVNTNFGLGIGATTPIKNPGKVFNFQGVILFYIADF